MAVKRVLAKIRPTATRGYTHGKPALFIIEDEAVLAASFGRKLFDLALGEIHFVPASLLGPQRVRGPPADLRG